MRKYLSLLTLTVHIHFHDQIWQWIYSELGGREFELHQALSAILADADSECFEVNQ